MWFKNKEEIIKTSIGNFSRTSLKGKKDMVAREFALLIDVQKENDYEEVKDFMESMRTLREHINPYMQRYHYIDNIKVTLYNICDETINKARAMKDDMEDNQELVEERNNIISDYC